MSSTRYRINAPSAVSETIDGEAVIMNLESGHYFSARGLAGALWEATIAGASPAELTGAVGAIWKDAASDSDIDAFLAQLTEHRLVVAANDSVSPPSVDAMTMLASVSGFAYQKPVLDAFTDMEDLLLLDPIHDVGEAGWPMPMSDNAAGPA